MTDFLISKNKLILHPSLESYTWSEGNHRPMTITAWKVPVFGVILVRIFPAFPVIWTECGEIRSRRHTESINLICFWLALLGSSVIFMHILNSGHCFFMFITNNIPSVPFLWYFTVSPKNVFCLPSVTVTEIFLSFIK